MDDYLLITTHLLSAKTFIDICYRKLPHYGAHIKHNKSLANFDYSVGELFIPKLQVRWVR